MNIIAEDFINSISKDEKSKTFVRMLFRGEFLTLGKRNKSYWKREGDAKNCLREHLKNIKYDTNLYEIVGYRTFRHKQSGTQYEFQEFYELEENAYEQILAEVTFVKVEMK